VTADAAFRLYSSVLEDEWSPCLGVTLCANHILVSRRSQLIVSERPVRVVAVGALHQPLIHFVVKGLAEGGFNVRMTAETELRLGRLKEVWILSGHFIACCLPLQRIAYARVWLQ
jgi:hypothetical protein